MNPEKLFGRIIEYGFYLLFFFVPLILLPYNYELFEFNKMILTYGLTIIIVSGWVGKSIIRRELVINKTPLDIPILIFLLSQLFSTIFSINVHTSIWGYYSRFHGGLLSTISYILLYYAFVSNMQQETSNKRQATSKKTINCIYLLLLSAFLVTGYGILEHFGIDANYWVQDVRNRVFSTLGQPNWLGAWIDGIVLIPLAFILTSSKEKHHSGLIKKHNSKIKNQKSKLKFKNQNLFFYFLLFTFYFCLLFTGSRSAFIGFLSTVGIFSLIILIHKKHLFKKLINVYLAIILISLLVGTPFTPSVSMIIKKQPVNPKPNYDNLPSMAQRISSSQEIRKVVWTGAIRIWKHFPVFGSGVETFAYSYYNYRPVEHNMLSEWDFLYNKAHNEYLNYLATTGIVGLGSYLFLIGMTLYHMYKIFNLKFEIFNKKSKIKNSLKIENSKLIIAIIAGYASILVTNFFGFSVVPVAILFWLFPALIFTLYPTSLKSVRLFNLPRFLKYPFLIIILVSGFWFLVSLAKIWLADYHFNKGRKYASSGYLLQGFQKIALASQLNPSEPLFKFDLGKNAALAALTYYQKDASQSAEIIDQFVELAKKETENGLKINNLHLNYLKVASQTYLYLAQIDPAYLVKSLDLLNRAHFLSPTDPKITLNLAVIYQQLGDNETAIEYLEKTVQLKPNYILGQLSLAKVYYNAGQTQKAINQLEFLLEKVDNKNEEAKILLQDWQEKNLDK